MLALAEALGVNCLAFQQEPTSIPETPGSASQDEPTPKERGKVKRPLGSFPMAVSSFALALKVDNGRQTAAFTGDCHDFGF